MLIMRHGEDLVAIMSKIHVARAEHAAHAGGRGFSGCPPLLHWALACCQASAGFLGCGSLRLWVGVFGWASSSPFFKRTFAFETFFGIIESLSTKNATIKVQVKIKVKVKVNNQINDNVKVQVVTFKLKSSLKLKFKFKLKME